MKKLLLIFIVILFLGIIGITGFYFWGMGPVSEDQTLKTFVIDPGTSKTTVAKNLEQAGLIKSQYALDLYLFFSGKKIQAGEYEIAESMEPTEMIRKFHEGEIKINTIVVTLVEGKRLTDYAKILDEKLEITASDFLEKANDRAFLNTLVSEGKYWFLTDEILNSELYYPLEGYLYPDTYEFLEDITSEEIIKMLLNHTETKLEAFKTDIMTSGKTVHELITMASIVETEANSSEDRKKASQVFYSRLKDNWSLGSDVTAFYGARKEMGKDAETWDVLNDVNPYNTRLTDGTMNGKLPIGPICNPSITSIDAALYPSETNYYYFVANVCTGEVFFQETSSEFYQKVRELQSVCTSN